MNCPKCGNTLREDMFCENCNEYLTNADTPKKGKPKKSLIKILVIIAACYTVSMCILLGVIKISENREYQKKLNTRYEEIYQEYLDNDYYSALNDINSFKDTCNDKKMLSKLSGLLNEIELTLYNDINSADIAISESNTYLEFFPDGKYADEVTDLLTVFIEKQAVQDIDKAKKAIKENDILKAGSLLQSVIDNAKVSENTKQQAQELFDPIADKVYAEKSKKTILGTWKKETGVQYTFEENGRMSVSLSSYYDNSLGTTLDGMEVNSLLSEINEFGRIVRIGTWEYTGTESDESGTVFAFYRLFYQGSQYSCLISVDDSRQMGIYLSSGIGDMSFLTK